jgi:type II secretory pathway component PulF
MTAGIPADDAAIIISRGLERAAAAVRIAEFFETAVKLRERNLPTRLVLDRIEQGLAKGVPADKIALVSQKLSANLADAGPLVKKMEAAGLNTDARVTEHVIETVARALEKKIPAEAILRAGEKVRQQNGSMAFYNRAVDTMTTFVGSGMAAEQAVRLVHAAMDRGYSERDLGAMERYMVNELRQNRAMNDIVSGMESRMERGGMRGTMDRQGGNLQNGSGFGGSGGFGGGPGMGGRR